MNARTIIIILAALGGLCVCGVCAAVVGLGAFGYLLVPVTNVPSATILPALTPARAFTPPVTLPTASPAPLATLGLPRATPTISATSSTRIAFTDDFSSGCNLLEGNDDKRALKCENGEYTILNKTNSSRWVYYSDELADVVVEVDARAVSGSALIEYGIVFRVAKDGKRFYGFTVTRDGKFTVFRHQSPDFTDLISYTANPSIKTGTATNHLKVVAQGNQIAVYVNDQWLNTISDAGIASGAVGFYLNNSEPNAKVAFDNLRVSEILNRLTLPKGIPTPTPTPPR